MYKYADVVLYPVKKMKEIKQKYGVPCFTKLQDEMIKRYQNGCRTEYMLGWFDEKKKTKYKLNKTARTLLLNGTLHKVSGECCKYTKKEPLKRYEKRTGLKPIMATRGSESLSRKNAYKTCITKKGMFTPMYDFTDEMVYAIYEFYKIEIPKVYEVVDRTGCIACPYGLHGSNTLKELNMVTPAQRKYAIDSFGESYKVLGLNIS
jgi:3'-phosphoadenosine 5'-phosphosulfate sulfotransferase (PAPS reductase)/FAD synthetase